MGSSGSVTGLHPNVIMWSTLLLVPGGTRTLGSVGVSTSNHAEHGWNVQMSYYQHQLSNYSGRLAFLTVSSCNTAMSGWPDVIQRALVYKA